MKLYPRHPRVLLSVLLVLGPPALARALPSTYDPFSEATPITLRDTPTALPTPTSPREPSWISCDLGSIIDGTKHLDCTMLGHDSPLHKRTVEMLGVDSHLHDVRVDEKLDIAHPAAKLHRCQLDHGSGWRRLRCKSAKRVSRKVLDGSAFESLLTGLLNGIPISVGPQIKVQPGFDTTNYVVSVYPIDNSYDLRLMADPPTTALQEEKFYSTQTDEQSSSNEKRSRALSVLALKGDLHCWYQENKYGTEAELNCAVSVKAFIDSDDRIGDESTESTTGSSYLGPYQHQIVEYICPIAVEGAVAIYASAISEEAVYLALDILARIIVTQLADLQSTWGIGAPPFNWMLILHSVGDCMRDAIMKQNQLSNRMNSINIAVTEEMKGFENALFYYTNHYLQNERSWHEATNPWAEFEIPRFYNLTRGQEHKEKHGALAKDLHKKSGVPSGGAPKPDVISSPGTIIKNWFNCSGEPGSKILCEIPDWHDRNLAQGETKLNKAPRGFDISDATFSSTVAEYQGPFYLLAAQPRFWHNCRLNRSGDEYIMLCPELPDPKYYTAPPVLSRTVKGRGLPSVLESLLHSRGSIESDPTISPVTQTQYEQPKPPIQALNLAPYKGLSFGKMTGTFAFVGFFTMLAIFTITLYWGVKNLFLALKDALNVLTEWVNRHKENRGLASTKDISLTGHSDLSVPTYRPGQHLFDISNGVAQPGNTALAQPTGLSLTSTGSQLIEEGADTIKRKKAALRAFTDEEDGSRIAEV